MCLYCFHKDKNGVEKELFLRDLVYSEYIFLKESNIKISQAEILTFIVRNVSLLPGSLRIIYCIEFSRIFSVQRCGRKFLSLIISNIIACNISPSTFLTKDVNSVIVTLFFPIRQETASSINFCFLKFRKKTIQLLLI